VLQTFPAKRGRLVAQRGQTESQRGRQSVSVRGRGRSDEDVFGVSQFSRGTNGSNLVRARQIFRCPLKSCRGFPLPIEAIHAETPISPTRRFPRRVQHLIPAIRSGFFRVRAESLVHG